MVMAVVVVVVLVLLVLFFLQSSQRWGTADAEIKLKQISRKRSIKSYCKTPPGENPAGYQRFPFSKPVVGPKYSFACCMHVPAYSSSAYLVSAFQLHFPHFLSNPQR